MTAMIYIHIPFCRNKCHYCNFFSLATKHGTLEIAEAICIEAKSRKEELHGQTVGSVYFGGGTPSLLPEREIDRMVDALNCHFTIRSDAEITIEANPEDINKPKIKAWKAAGINRLSIGIQSFFEADLRYLHRSHNTEDALRALDIAMESDINNISADLIYGIPTLTLEEWMHNLNEIGRRKLDHLSAYALTVEPNTILQWRIGRQQAATPDETAQVEQFLALNRWANEGGYIHYEISNLCLPGMESRHNSGYWNGNHYLGLGPSAHSYNGKIRKWNVAHLADYIAQAKAGQFYPQSETLSTADRYNEYVMTALRTSTGISPQKVAALFGQKWLQHFNSNVNKFVLCGWVEQAPDCYRLTVKGMLYADSIASDLFIDVLNIH